MGEKELIVIRIDAGAQKEQIGHSVVSIPEETYDADNYIEEVEEQLDLTPSESWLQIEPTQENLNAVDQLRAEIASRLK